MAAPAGLRFASAVHRLGRIPKGTARCVLLPWRRTGSGRLRVLGVRVGCGCALIEPLPETLPAGARGTLRVHLMPRDQVGPFTVQVRVHTGVAPGCRVRISGYVECPVLIVPAALRLGPHSPGRRIRRRLEVRWAGPEDADAVAPAGAPLVTAHPLTAHLRGLGGRIEVQPLGRTAQSGLLLSCLIDVPRTVGPFAGAVEIRRGDLLLATAPISGHVVR